jgi:asparagine synthase (glutamine-hydrolysing)
MQPKQKDNGASAGQSLLLNEPFFYAKKAGDHFQTKGTAKCFLGHRIKANGAAPGEGVFAEWEWDGQRVRLHTDAHGFYPVYYFANDNEIGISPSIPALLTLGAATDLDYPGLAVFLRVGFFVAEDTPFKSIRACPPAANIEWSSGRLRIAGELPASKLNQMDRSRAIDGYVDLFRAAVQRRLPESEDFAVTLSGGRDSRHILLELCHAGFRPKVCATVGTYLYGENHEAQVASNLAASLGLHHTIVDQRESTFSLVSKRVHVTNFCADEHEWLFTAAEYLEGKVSTIYDGLGGSLFCDGFGLNQARHRFCETGNIKALADDLLGPDVAMLMLRKTELQKVSRAIAIDRLMDELKRHAGAPNPVCSFFFWNRSRREVSLSPYRIFNRFKSVYSPFTDIALTQHLSSLPSGMVIDHTFHNDTIARAFPRHAHIPYAKKPGFPRMNLKAFRQFARDVGRFSIENGISSIISYSWLFPRLVRCFLDKEYSSSILWIGPCTMYFLHLERIRRAADKGLLSR